MEHPYECTLVQMIETVCERAPHRVALWVDDEPVTYEELVTRSRAYANALTGLGIGRGDVVSTLMSNCAEPLKRIAIAVADGTAVRKAFRAREAVADGVVLARDLVNEPANVLYPEEFARRANALKKVGVAVENGRPVEDGQAGQGLRI